MFRCFVQSSIAQFSNRHFDCIYDRIGNVSTDLGRVWADRHQNTEEEWRAVADRYLERWHFPNCIGALDGKHCRIQAPPHSGSLDYNFHQYFSVSFIFFSHNLTILSPLFRWIWRHFAMPTTNYYSSMLDRMGTTTTPANSKHWNSASIWWIIDAHCHRHLFYLLRIFAYHISSLPMTSIRWSRIWWNRTQIED